MERLIEKMDREAWEDKEYDRLKDMQEEREFDRIEKLRGGL